MPHTAAGTLWAHWQAGNRMRVAEPGMALRMARDLPDSHFAHFTAAGEARLLADNACARHFVPGQVSMRRADR